MNLKNEIKVLACLLLAMLVVSPVFYIMWDSLTNPVQLP